MAATIGRRRLRLTIRLRLTLLYSALFVASSAALLAITYGLVDRATRNQTVELPGGGSVSGQLTEEPSGSEPAVERESRTDTGISPTGSVPAEEVPSLEEIAELAEQQQDDQMRAFLEQALIAFAIMAVVSVGAGWLAAGRALRNVRTITTAARDISASNLHERLALEGPDDELKELADTFDAVLARLDAAFAAQQRFVADASHELRTPLARQRTLIQVALADPDTPAEVLRATHRRVLAAGDEQVRLLDALLTLARGQAGVDRSEDFDLATVADEVLLRCEAEARARCVAVRSTLAAAPACGDRRLVERLVTNVVDNAVRHNVTGGDGAAGWIEVVTASCDARAVLTVTNTGPPVPADEVDELFVPFHRLGAERTTIGGGLGLGLSIVQAIADAHGATIAATANPDGGLSVEVTFPAQLPRSAASPHRPDIPHHQGANHA
jgi:signal transduction histidine kinase